VHFGRRALRPVNINRYKIYCQSEELKLIRSLLPASHYTLNLIGSNGEIAQNVNSSSFRFFSSFFIFAYLNLLFSIPSTARPKKNRSMGKFNQNSLLKFPGCYSIKKRLLCLLCVGVMENSMDQLTVKASPFLSTLIGCQCMVDQLFVFVEDRRSKRPSIHFILLVNESIDHREA
jgi:hypothetical protein